MAGMLSTVTFYRTQCHGSPSIKQCMYDMLLLALEEFWLLSALSAITVLPGLQRVNQDVHYDMKEHTQQEWGSALT